MVGVAGKSKACNNCKRRRVKCGFERPTCLRCAGAGLACGGYNLQTFFVNRTLENPSVSAPAVLAKKSPSRLQQSSDGAETEISAVPRRRSSVSDELEELVVLADTRNTPIAPSPRFFREKAFQLIQKVYLPRPEVAGEGSSHANPGVWIGAVCKLEDPSPLLDHALVAFCTIQVHVVSPEDVPRDRAIEKYNAALEHMSTALSQGEQTKLDYALAAIVVLSTCEIFCFPTDDGLQVHIQGVADILRLRKGTSDIPSSTIWTRIWSRLRVISTLSQLSRGPRWSGDVFEWGDFIPEKHTLDHLDQLMIMVRDLPSTLQSATDELPGSHLAAGPDLTASITALWSILRNIYAWQAILYTSSSTLAAAYTYQPSMAYNPSDQGRDTKGVPFSLHFSSLQTASLFVISWAFQLHIHIVLQHAAERLGDLAVVPAEFLILHNGFGSIKKEASKLARLLCQSVEYCHRREMGTFGPQLMVYALWVVRQFYARWGTEREILWCDQVKNMGGEGFQFGIQLITFGGSINLT